MNEYPPGPFSLGQAERVQSQSPCPYCGHRRGDIHPILQKPWCLHQWAAGEIIKWHRNIAMTAEYCTAGELL